jgi:pimeloyl-ACP methyl ester carboxylesterase
MSSERQPDFLDVGEGERRRRIAFIHSPASAPGGAGVMWLIGLKSDMGSTKAAALAEWAAARGIGCTRFDYSGHGQSSGRFEDALIGDWLEEAAEVYRRVTSGPQVVVGSSTGGHVALLLLRKLMREDPAEAARLKGLVLVAPAWDLTEELMWNELSDEAKRELMEKGSYTLPSDYDAGGYVITRRFIEEGRDHLFRREPFDPERPVAILQGLLDTDVPPAHARELLSFLTGGWATITEVADAGHRLSRPEDLERLFNLIEAILAR